MVPLDAKVRALIAEACNLPSDVSKLSSIDDLYVAGLTSFASVQLMLALEEQFDVEFPERLLSRKTFSSIASIVEALNEIHAQV